MACGTVFGLILRIILVISMTVHDTGAVSMNDFIMINMSNHIFWLSRTYVPRETAISDCSTIKSQLALFETNQEFNSTMYSIFSSTSVTEVWLKLQLTDADQNMRYEHHWQNEPVNALLWLTGEPVECGVAVNATTPCCPAMKWYGKGLGHGACTSKYSYLCKPKNECLDGTANCSQMCRDDLYGFTCLCSTSGFRLAADNRTCEDVDECKSSPCQHVCNNTAGSYICSCLDGYKLRNGTGKCDDIDECAATSPCQQVCTNSIGSFTCNCSIGYKLDNSSTCVDIDECTASSPCQHVCINSIGSFTCECYVGYTLGQNRSTCVDIDECANGTLSPCQQVCVNVRGSHECECYAGYALSNDSRSCSDIDECYSGPCEQLCLNAPGSFNCSCVSGYTLDVDTTHCVSDSYSTTPAEITSSVSVRYQPANNTSNSSCPIGYIADSVNQTCLDLDECMANMSVCIGPCTNTQGGYYCGCPGGYIQDTLECIDIDECQLKQDNCSQACNNTAGSYQCTCEQGFRLSADKSTCNDIDECQEGLHDCQQNCRNIHGSYMCTCYSGYVIDPVSHSTCHDIDECSLNSTLCSHYCSNTLGSFYCSCYHGYTLQKDQCVQKKNFNYCPCSCLYLDQCKLFNKQYAQKQLIQLKQHLLLSKADLMSFKLLRFCQDDPRTTSESLGVCGIIILTAVIGVLILPDLFFLLFTFIVFMKRLGQNSKPLKR